MDRICNNIWYPKRDRSEVLYLPLWHPKLLGGTFHSFDSYHHLCTVAGALWTPQGRSFDGVDDVINCGDNVALDIIDAITLEVWVKVNALNLLQFFIGRDDGTNRNYFLLAENSMNKVQFVIPGQPAQTSTTIITTGVWYHWVGTYNRVVENIYLNGVVDAAPVSATGAILNGDVSLTIGLRAVLNDRDLNGVIGEAWIYNRALSAAEILHNYLATKWRYQ